ncbi:MAG TPA: transglutaminase family protein [Stellaceae bacterium]|nr:transglutaminase family protein [Stellaceae bacterium]
MRYDVRHRSTYIYAQPVDLSHHMLKLTPRALGFQSVLASAIETNPSPAFMGAAADYFGNGVTFLALTEPHDRLQVEMHATVEVKFPQPPPAETTPAWNSVRDALRTAPDTDLLEASEFVYESPLTPVDAEIAAYAAPSFPPDRPLLAAALDLNQRIHRDFIFDGNATLVSTPLSEVMKRRRGVCQDFAHLTLAAHRAMGLAARYISGYIRTYHQQDGPILAGADASHAWVSIYCPGAGWVDLDPTNDLVVSEEHIVLAWGRDYGDISPIRGVILGGGEHTLDVAVDVVPIT